MPVVEWPLVVCFPKLLFLRMYWQSDVFVHLDGPWGNGRDSRPINPGFAGGCLIAAYLCSDR